MEAGYCEEEDCFTKKEKKDAGVLHRFGFYDFFFFFFVNVDVQQLKLYDKF
jgi:hypothetical protein